MDKHRVIIVPFAGGISCAFSELTQLLEDKFDVSTVEMKGHGTRYAEGLCMSWDELVNDVEKKIDDILSTKQSYSLFGYSMGAKIVYDIASRKVKKGDIPKHIFFVAAEPPHIQNNSESHYSSSIDEIYTIYHHDVSLDKQFNVNISEISKLGCNISVLYSDDEDKMALLGWKKYTDNNCSYYYIGNSHMFIYEEAEMIAQVISKEIMER